MRQNLLKGGKGAVRECFYRMGKEEEGSAKKNFAWHPRGPDYNMTVIQLNKNDNGRENLPFL